MGSTSITPESRNYAQETRDTLQAQIDLAPQQYAAEQKFRPGYTQLDLQMLAQALLGGPGGTQTRERQVMDTVPSGWYDKEGQMVSQDVNWSQANKKITTGTGMSIALPSEYVWRNGSTTPRTITESYQTPATRGLIDIYGEAVPKLGDIENAAQAKRMAGEMGIISQYGPEVTARMREAAGNAKLIAMLNKQAEDELALGAQLDPSLRREVAQSIRSAQSARGLGLGPADVTEEAFATGLRAEQLRRTRQAFATGIAGLDQQTGGDIFMALLGRPSSTFNAAQGFGAQGQGLSQGGPQLFNPESQYANQVYDFNANAASAAKIGSANNRSALIGAGISAMGSLAGAGILA